jgi:hypothetical protein
LLVVYVSVILFSLRQKDCILVDISHTDFRLSLLVGVDLGTNRVPFESAVADPAVAPSVMCLPTGPALTGPCGFVVSGAMVLLVSFRERLSLWATRTGRITKSIIPGNCSIQTRWMCEVWLIYLVCLSLLYFLCLRAFPSCFPPS